MDRHHRVVIRDDGYGRHVDPAKIRSERDKGRDQRGCFLGRYTAFLLAVSLFSLVPGPDMLFILANATALG